MKKKILDKTLELASKYGIRNISLDILASELGISKKTIYQYYSNKNELVLSCIDVVLNSLENKIIVEANSENHPVIKICNIYAHCIDLVLNFSNTFFRDLIKFYPQSYEKIKNFREDFLYEKITDLLKECEKLEVFRENINIYFVYQIHLNKIQELMGNTFFRGNISNENALEYIIINNIRGILNPKSVPLLDNYKRATYK
jgi:AcrR family transcriptional regulator